MLYMHYCSHCQRLHILNGHKKFCPGCENNLTELKLSCMDYVKMDENARFNLLAILNTPEGLNNHSSHTKQSNPSKPFSEI